MTITKIEATLILDLAGQKISKEEFYKRYPVEILSRSNYILDMLEEAYEEKDSSALEYIFYLRGFHQDVEPAENHVAILKRLLGENWHKSHEYIVDALEILRDSGAIEPLIARANGELAHLDELDNRSLRKRCVYAISKIGGDLAENALKFLSTSRYEEVKDLAGELRNEPTSQP